MQSIRIAVLALALCFGASLLPVQSHAAAPLPKVKIETSMGDIVVELNPAKAPKTVSNFLYYVKPKPAKAGKNRRRWRRWTWPRFSRRLPRT